MLMSIILSNIQLLIVNIYLLILQDFFFRLKPKQLKNAKIADCLKNHLETHETKQIGCQSIWQETVRKLIDGPERLGLYGFQVGCGVYE